MEPRQQPFSWPAVLYQNDSLAAEFLNDPSGFAERLGIDLSDLACPDEAHRAWERGEAFTNEAIEAGIEPTEKAIANLRTIAANHLGDDFEAEFIPFGLRFRERISHDGELGVTATVSGKITWLDGGPDVDG